MGLIYCQSDQTPQDFLLLYAHKKISFHVRIWKHSSVSINIKDWYDISCFFNISLCIQLYTDMNCSTSSPWYMLRKSESIYCIHTVYIHYYNHESTRRDVINRANVSNNTHDTFIGGAQKQGAYIIFIWNPGNLLSDPLLL